MKQNKMSIITLYFVNREFNKQLKVINDKYKGLVILNFEPCKSALDYLNYINLHVTVNPEKMLICDL